MLTKGVRKFFACASDKCARFFDIINVAYKVLQSHNNDVNATHVCREQARRREQLLEDLMIGSKPDIQRKARLLKRMLEAWQERFGCKRGRYGDGWVRR